MTDAFARPTLKDLHAILESIGKYDPPADQRTVPRLELCVPAEIKTARGNTVSAMTREISRGGIGLLTKGGLTLGHCRITMASETRQFEYEVEIEWSRPADNGMFLSGGRFVPAAEPVL